MKGYRMRDVVQDLELLTSKENVASDRRKVEDIWGRYNADNRAYMSGGEMAGEITVPITHSASHIARTDKVSCIH
jgi:hypothetical protein